MDIEKNTNNNITQIEMFFKNITNVVQKHENLTGAKIILLVLLQKITTISKNNKIYL